MKRLIAMALFLFSVGCTDEQEALRVLTASGYTDIQFTGWSWLGCSEDDTYHTGFRAKGPTGVQTEGVVCCGLWFKNCTIRM